MQGLVRGGIAAGAVLLAGLLLFSCACERIEVGSVGLKINKLGDQRGLENAPTVSGWVWYNPITSDVVEFPTTIQTVKWEKGEDSNEEITFSSKEGMIVIADVAFSFQMNPALAPKFYGKYKQRDLDMFAHGFLRNMVRDAINDEASRMAIHDIYGEKKGELLSKAKKHLIATIGPDGVDVSQLTFNAIRLPENVQKAIDASIQQTQEAQRAQYRVAQVEAEARQKVAEAEGAAKAATTKADATAYAILKEAEAEAKANELLQKSLEGNSKLIQYELAKKWDGRMPMISGEGAQTLVDLRALGAQ